MAPAVLAMPAVVSCVTVFSAPCVTVFCVPRQLHRQLSKERNTWRLLCSLYRDRLLVTSEEAGALLVENVGRPLSDRKIADNLFKCDTAVRQVR